MSEPNKDGTDIMMALLMGLSGPRASKAWNESQQIKAESFLTMAEHWINQTADENTRLKAEVERLTKAGDLLAVHYTALSKCVTPNNAKSGSINDWTSVIDWNAAKEGNGQP
jgi:hypothetical protein